MKRNLVERLCAVAVLLSSVAGIAAVTAGADGRIAVGCSIAIIVAALANVMLSYWR